MGRVQSNYISLAYSIESAVGTAGTSWRFLQPNEPRVYGQQITLTPRRPLSKRRGRRKGVPTSASSDVEFGADLTMDSLVDFIEGFMFSEFVNVGFDLKSSGSPPPAVDGGGGADSFTISAASALLAGKITGGTAGSAPQTLIYAKGYGEAGNNGIWPLVTDLTTSGTALEVLTGSLTAEPSPPSNASLQVCGVRVPQNDLALTVSGSTATLVSTAITNWATLGLIPGMFIHIGGVDLSTGTVINALNASTADDTFGYARIASISGTTLNLDKLDPNLAATAGHASDGVADVLFGRAVRNVSVDSDDDDNRYLERTYHFELAYPNLGSGGATEYEYSRGNHPNAITLEHQTEDKALASWTFVGTGTDDITTTQKAGASSAVEVLREAALSNGADFAVITTDMVSSQSEVCFFDMNLEINNNAAAERCLGKLPPAVVNSGAFEVNLEAQMLFANKAIVNAVKNGTTVTMHYGMFNEDGAAIFDIPSAVVSDGSREYPENESVKVNVTFESFTDPVLGYDMMASIFPVVPSIRPDL